MRIVVYGAGSIGCYVGGRLLAAGADVTLIVRPAMAARLEADGLRLSDYRGYTKTIPPGRVPCRTDAEAVRDADLVLVTVKSAATASVAATLAGRLKPGAVVLSLQNGLHNADVLAAALPGQTVLAGMVPFNVVQTADGRFHQGSAGDLTAEQNVALYHALPAFSGAGLPLTLAPDMRAVQWAKLLLNLNNPVNALSGLPLKAELEQRDYRRVLAAAQREALALLARREQPLAKLTPLPPRRIPSLLELPDWVFRLAAQRMLAIDPEARSSMWEDLEAGRPTEIDYINGEVVALADTLGQAAPVNRALVRLIRAAEAGGRRDWSGRALLHAVHEAL